MKKIICSLILALSLLPMLCYATTVDTKLTVNENNVLKTSSKNMLGINDNWGTNVLYTGGLTKTVLSDNYKNTVFSSGVSLNQNRMAGADAHAFYWKDSLGPLEERANGSNLGLVEWIKFNKEMNPDIALTFTLNIHDSLENHKDLVRFLLLNPDDPNAVDSNGFNWAKYRVELGIKEPVDIKTFEIGNEVYYNYVEGCNDVGNVSDDVVIAGVENYIADCKEIIAAMKSVKEDINFSAATFSYTKRTAENTKAWNQRLIEALYEDCSYFVHHEYYFDYNFFWITKQIKGRLLDIIEDLPVSEEEKPKVYISEYGYWMERNLDNFNDGTSLYGTLANAKFLNFLMDMPYIEMANIHVTNEDVSSDEYWLSGWDLFRFYEDGKIYVTGPAEMLKIFNSAVGNGESANVVESTLSKKSFLSTNKYLGEYSNYIDTSTEPENKDIMNVSAHTTSDGGLNLLFVNSSETVEHKVSMSFKKSYKLHEVEILTSESISDNNLPESSDKLYTKRYLVNDTTTLSSYTIPAKSIVLLKLRPLNETTQEKDNIEFTCDFNITNNNVTVYDNFGIRLSLYENETMSKQSDCDLYIIKNDITPEEFMEDIQSNIDKIVYTSNSDIVRNYLYYDVTMPEDAQAGNYYAIIGKPAEGFYKSVSFKYAHKADTSALTILDAKADKDLPQVNIQYNSDFENEPVVIRIIKKTDREEIDRDIVCTEVINASKAGTYKAIMPDDALTGIYTAEILWFNKGVQKKAKYDFEYENKEHKVALLTLPSDSNGNAVVFVNIADANELNFKLANRTNEDITIDVIVAAFDKDDGLKKCYKTNGISIDAFSSTDAKISLDEAVNLAEVDYIRIFVWDKDITPLTNAIYIK